MALHYVRDVLMPGSYPSYAVYYHDSEFQMNMISYHLTRLMGAEWQWECDGDSGAIVDPGHVPDGNMKTAGVGDWTALGSPLALLAKDTAEKFSGTQSLRVTSKSVGSGVKSSALTSMRAPIVVGINSTSNYLAPQGKGVMLMYQVASGTLCATQVHCNTRLTLSGCTFPGNNGTFPIIKADSSRSTYFYNPSGAYEVMSGGTHSARIEHRYDVVVWAKAAVGETWTVKADPGTGVLTTIGTLVGDGTFKAYHYSFWRTGSGSSYVQITDEAWSSDHTLYVNAILCFRSWFEYNQLNVEGSDGSITNPDLFSTGSYTPTPDDVGKHIVCYDADHPENTGCWEITAVSGGKYQVDPRSGSATLTSHALADIPWRIIDLKNTRMLRLDVNDGSSCLATCGVGIKSKHASGWQYFTRMSASGTGERKWIVWASPEEQGYDLVTGHFDGDQVSTLDVTGPFVLNGAGQFYWGGLSTGGANGYSGARLFFMTDDDLSFLALYSWAIGGGGSRSGDGAMFIGYAGTDPDHPGIQEFVVGVPRGTPQSGPNCAAFDGADTRCTTNLVLFNEHGTPIRGECAVLGYSAGTPCVLTMSNACPNPWSGEEHVDRLYLVRDPYGFEGWPSELEFTKGIYMARTGLSQLQTFASGEYLHFLNGWVWKWNGATILT